MLSYWEHESFIKYDYTIVGSGIVGLSTAISIKEQAPKASVLILEKGILPTGASTKNAGFACFGSLTELLSDIEELGKERAFDLVHERYSGLRALRKRLGDDNLNYEPHGGYELIGQQDIKQVSRIDEVNEWLSPLFKENVFSTGADDSKKFGFSNQHVSNIVFNKFEGQIHTGKMMASLLNLAQQLGIKVITGAEVTHIEDKGHSVEVTVRNLTLEETIRFQAGKIIICTNAFTSSLIPDVDINPGRGIVLITKPIDNLPFKGCFHMDQGYYYFRDIDSRVLFGGGRNLFFEEETTTRFEINEKIIGDLQQKLSDIILPNTSFEIDYSWAGIMGFGKNKEPILQFQSDNVALGVRLGGMGVAIGSRLGEKLAKMVL